MHFINWSNFKVTYPIMKQPHQNGLLKVHTSSSCFNYSILPDGGRADEQDNTLLSMFYLNKTQSVNHSKMSYLKVDTDADRC